MKSPNQVRHPTVNRFPARLASDQRGRGPSRRVCALPAPAYRERPRKFLAIDELDLFLHMYATGLYVEPDPDEVARELPQFPPASVADRCRHARQPTEILTSRTDDLDAWYFHRLASEARWQVNATPSCSSSLNACRTICARLAEHRYDATRGLLKAAAPVGGARPDAVQTDGSGRKGAHLHGRGGHRADMSFLLVWASLAPGRPRRDAERHFRDYLAAKKHQMQVARRVVL